MRVNIDTFKKNILYITVCIVLIIILVFLNGTINDIYLSTTKLTDIDTSINKLVINEVMTSNKGAYVDNQGNLYDFIELYNGSDKDIKLFNYGLSDREDGKVKWLFPDVTIKKDSYLIIYLTKESQDGLYANFALKEEGKEIITLKKPNGKVVDTIKTLEIPANYTMIRDNNGNFSITDEITPGFPNTEKGRKEFLNKIKNNLNKELEITEILPSNEGNIIFDDNKLYGYIEITNISENIINLKDYYLSNEEKALYKWNLEDKELLPNETYLAYTNKKSYGNNASFELKNKNGQVFLSNKLGIIDEIKYEDLLNGVAFIKFGEKWYQSSDISPNYLNTSKGKTEFQKNANKTKKELIISEVMSSNSKYLPQYGNQYYDWIELYNNTDETISLDNYSLTTDKDYKDMFKLPKMKLKPKEYIVLKASGDTTLTDKEYIHTNFKLSNNEGVLLYKEDELVDSLFIHSIPLNYSYGRNIDYGNFYYQNPTPKVKNDINGIQELSIKPVFSIDGGVYNDIESLEITLSGSGDIYYTMDGSIPNNLSKKYTKPIIINKTSVIRAVAIEKGKDNSEVVTNSYIINENHTLPVISISLDKSDFTKLITNKRSNTKYNSHVDFFEKESSFSLDSGIRLFGGASREFEKKSFILKFSKEYSESLKYKVFDDKDILEFNDLVLRSGSQEQNKSMIKDEFISTIAIRYTTLDAQAVKPTVVYINGEYYGLYFIRERINNNFILRNHNVEGTTNIINAYSNQIENGSDTAFLKLRNYVKTHDLTTEDAYSYVDKVLDIENFIDYYVMQFILCNYDLLNIRMYNNQNINNGKIRMILYDTDYAFLADTGANFLDYVKNPFYLNPLPDTSIYTELMKNEKYRKKFVERISYFMKNVWTKENIEKTYDELYNAVKEEMKRNTSRWNQDYQTWEKYVKRLKEDALSKINNIPKYTKTYFNLTKEEYDEYFD